MAEHAKDAHAPTRKDRGARTETRPKSAALIVTLTYEDWVRTREIRALKQGLAIGLLAGLTALCLVLWLWAIPTVQGAVAAVGA